MARVREAAISMRDRISKEPPPGATALEARTLEPTLTLTLTLILTLTLTLTLTLNPNLNPNPNPTPHPTPTPDPDPNPNQERALGQWDEWRCPAWPGDAAGRFREGRWWEATGREKAAEERCRAACGHRTR